MKIFGDGTIVLKLWLDFWECLESVHKFLIELGNKLKAILELINDSVEPESISNLRIYSEIKMYGNSLQFEIKVLNGISNEFIFADRSGVPLKKFHQM